MSALTREQIELLRTVDRVGDYRVSSIVTNYTDIDHLIVRGFLATYSSKPGAPTFVSLTRSGIYRTLLGDAPDADEVHAAMLAADPHLMPPAQQIAFVRGYRAGREATHPNPGLARLRRLRESLAEGIEQLEALETETP